jgi:methionine-rich copper-binding protein CopC
MRRLLAVLAVLILPASVALATEPSSGEVSKANPKFQWTGSTTSSYPNFVAMGQDPDGTPCQSPACDTFALKVADGGIDLIFKAHMDKDGSTGPANTGLRITKPDGTKQYTTGPSGAASELKVTLKKAPAGDYVVDLVNNFVGQPQTFTASAELAVPAAPAPAAPAPAAPPAAQAPAAAPETKLTVKPARIKAKAKKLSVAVTASAPITGVTATLAKGGKKVATGKAARVEGSAKIAVKLAKKLKPGKYLMTVTGTDAQGRAVTGQAAVTVRR